MLPESKMKKIVTDNSGMLTFLLMLLLLIL